MVKTKSDLLTKTEFEDSVTLYRKEVSKLPKLVPLIYTASEIRQSLLERDEMLRKTMAQFGKTPKLGYLVSEDGGSFLVTIVRKSREDSLYSGFAYRFSVKSVHYLSGLQEFQEGVFYQLLKELLISRNLGYINSLLESQLEENSFSVEFMPDTLKSGYVSFISNSSLVLIADTESLFSLVDALKNSDIERVKELEYNSLSVCQSTVEVLGVKSPIIKYLLNSGKLGLKKLLKPVYNKTIKQLKTYPSALGYGYYLEGSSYGVLNRSEYGLEVVLDVYNLDTFEKEDLDLLEEVK